MWSNRQYIHTTHYTLGVARARTGGRKPKKLSGRGLKLV